MATWLSYRDGGKTNEEGLFKWFSRLFTTGFPTTFSSTSMQAVQRGAGANMSVDVSIGDVSLPDTAGSGYNLYGWNDAAANVAVTASDPTNPRIDIVYCYVDLSVVQSVTSNNTGALKFGVYAGTPAGSPVAPADATIQAFLGASTPFVKISSLAIAAVATQVVNANITDLRKPIALYARLWGGASNTIGHLVPNIADDTVALLNAAQTFVNKTFTAPVLNNPTIQGQTGWQATAAPTAVSYLGNRSYQLTHAASILSFKTPGMRNRYTRTVTAPTQCTSLNGSTQFFNNTSVNKMTFTDDFVVSAWVKLSSYPGSNVYIASRYNGTSGWGFGVNSFGQLLLIGFNASAANNSTVNTYQALPLNRWIHVAAQLDMSTFTATPTTSYTMIDGVDVPASVTRAGTNPTALIQAGNLEIGSTNAGTSPFPGKLAQVAIYSAKVTQVTIAAASNQTLVGTETNLASAYSFSNSINDLNTTTPNNLTANGSAVATNADDPFAGGATQQNYAAGTTDFSVTTLISSDGLTETVQIPEGYTLPTTGGLSAEYYCIDKLGYGFPTQQGKWFVFSMLGNSTANGASGSFVNSNLSLNMPIGSWLAEYDVAYYSDSGASIARTHSVTLSTSTSVESDALAWTTLGQAGVLSATAFLTTLHTRTQPLDITTATPYYILFKETNGSTANNQLTAGSFIRLRNAYL